MSALVDHIVRDEGICGGEPRIRGTRIAVRTIMESIRLSHAKDPVLQALPDLTPDDVEAALVYYAEHPEEIDRYIGEHTVAEEDLADVPRVLKPCR